MTDLDRPIKPEPPKEKPLKRPPKGDVLFSEWGERPPWFGYIGVGIVLAAMLLGIAGMVVTIMYGVQWMQR